MRKNDYGSNKSPRTPSGGRPERSGTGKRDDRQNSGYAKRAGQSTEGYRDSTRNAGRGAGDNRSQRSSEWSTGGYRVKNKNTSKNEPWNYEQKTEGYKGPRRDSEPKTGGYRGRREDAKAGGYRGRREDSEAKVGGYRGKRDEAPRPGGFRDSKRSFQGKGPRTNFGRKYDNQAVKTDAFKKNEAPVQYNEAEVENEDYRIEGRNSVFEAIRSGRPINKLFVEKDKEDTLISRIVAMAREKDIPIQYFEKFKLDSMSQTRVHQGVILEVAAKEYVEVEDILSYAAEKEEKPFILVLDGITDTNNLGSIIRSAECAGVHGIIIPKRRSATINTTVAKVAAGALEYVPVARVGNLVQTLRQLKENGVWIIGADMEGSGNYYDTDLKGACALVIGSEGEGLARLVKNECDLMVKIPMKGKISSLNAGVAAALVMFEISKQRDSAK